MPSPSPKFISLTRNPVLESPRRFTPLPKQPGTLVLQLGKMVEVR